MHLIFLTGFLQVSLATEAIDSTTVGTSDNKSVSSVSSDVDKQVGNPELVSSDGINLSELPKDYNCSDNGAAIIEECIDFAKKEANIIEDLKTLPTFLKFLDNLTKSKNENDRKRGCKGILTLNYQLSQRYCQSCPYFVATIMDFFATFTRSKYDKECTVFDNFEIEPFCTITKWKNWHINETYWGECVPDDEKLKCVKEAVPEATDWYDGMFTAFNDSLHDGEKNCPKMFEMTKCELKAACKKCDKDQFEKFGEVTVDLAFFQGLEASSVVKSCLDYGLKASDLNQVCPKMPTVAPTEATTTTKKATTTTKKPNTDAPMSTESDSTAIIIVVSVLAIVIVVISIIAYCFCCAGSGKEKKPVGKQQPKQMASKGPSSKMGSSKPARGKSSSVSARGAAKSQVSGAKVGSKMDGSKLGGSKVNGSKMGVSKSLA